MKEKINEFLTGLGHALDDLAPLRQPVDYRGFIRPVTLPASSEAVRNGARSISATELTPLRSLF
jgi:hypothetical protein